MAQGDELDRLVDEIIRASSDGTNGRRHVAERGDDDHRRARAILRDTPADVQPAHVLEVYVRDDDVEIPLSQQLEPFVATQAPLHFMTAPSQAMLDQLTHVLVVVDHQYSCAHAKPFR